MCYNCLDVHVANGLGDRPAYLLEGNEEGESGCGASTSVAVAK